MGGRGALDLICRRSSSGTRTPWGTTRGQPTQPVGALLRSRAVMDDETAPAVLWHAKRERIRCAPARVDLRP
jgi:hypothetical protein